MEKKNARRRRRTPHEIDAYKAMQRRRGRADGAPKKAQKNPVTG